MLLALLGRGQKCDSNFAVNRTVPFNKELTIWRWGNGSCKVLATYA